MPTVVAQDRPRPNDVTEFVKTYRPCRRAVEQSLQFRSSMFDAWEQSTNGEWLVWIMNRLSIDHPQVAAIRQEVMGPVRAARVDAMKEFIANPRAMMPRGSKDAIRPLLSLGAGGEQATFQDRRRERQERRRLRDEQRSNFDKRRSAFQAARKDALVTFAQRIRAVIPNPFPKP
jgi:hypothetical protein